MTQFYGTFISSVAALGTIGAFVSSYLIFRLESRLDKRRRPDVRLWFNSDPANPSTGILTVVNTGERILPLRLMDIANDGGPNYVLSFEREQVRDLLIQPDRIYKISVRSTGGEPTRFKLRMQFYDGTFVVLDVEPANPGPYHIERN